MATSKPEFDLRVADATHDISLKLAKAVQDLTPDALAKFRLDIRLLQVAVARAAVTIAAANIIAVADLDDAEQRALIKQLHAVIDPPVRRSLAR